MEVYHKHISRFELATAAVLYGMLILTIAIQIIYKENLLLLTFLLLGCVAVFSWLVFVPERYELCSEFLLVLQLGKWKEKRIFYSDIWDIDTVGTFRSSKQDLDSVEVILKYKTGRGNESRSISCHPKNVLGFVKSLQMRCPNLIERTDPKESA